MNNKLWKCPKCGRSFKRNNQSHYCGVAPETIDDYIELQAEDVKEQLRKVRDIIRNEIPKAKEKISWSMPTFWEKHNIIQFAAHKNHIGIYPGEQAVIFFREQLNKGGYKFSKGSIQIPYSKNLPLELIADIAAWCYKKDDSLD